MQSLFENLNNNKKPLAERMRPNNLDDFVGQKHIIGFGKLLRRLIESKMVPSVIFYGHILWSTRNREDNACKNYS